MLYQLSHFRSMSPTLEEWCRGPGSNWRHRDFQSRALPTELPRLDGQPHWLSVGGAQDTTGLRPDATTGGPLWSLRSAPRAGATGSGSTVTYEHGCHSNLTCGVATVLAHWTRATGSGAGALGMGLALAYDPWQGRTASQRHDAAPYSNPASCASSASPSGGSPVSCRNRLTRSMIAGWVDIRFDERFSNRLIGFVK